MPARSASPVAGSSARTRRRWPPRCASRRRRSASSDTLTEALGYLDPFATITAFRVTPVVGLVSRAATFRADPREVDEIFEAPLDFFLDPAHCEERSREFQGRVRHYHVYTWGGREIWGATASMLLNLARRWQRAAGEP